MKALTSFPMSPEYIHIETSSLEVDEQGILDLLYPAEQVPDDHTRLLVSELKQKCMEKWIPQAAVVFTKAREPLDHTTISTGETQFDCGGTIAKMLRGSEKYAFFIATIGPGPEEMARSMLDTGQYPEAYITDLIASALTEVTAENCHRYIQDHAREQELKITNRYSPGYCGWKVEEQQKLFSLFPGNSCGIRLLKSSLMYPIKSVSAVVGMGTEVSYREYTCELCSMTECMYRKTRPGHTDGKKQAPDR